MEEYYIVKMEDGVPTKGVFRYEHMWTMFPNTSFPENPNIEMLASYGFAPWLFTPQPFADEKRVVIEGTPINTGGIWQQMWTDRAMTSEELAVATEQKWIEIRQMRTNLLFDCDWTQLPDAPLTDEEKAAWAAYRQSLRDLPDLVTDPFDVTWPLKPQ